MRPRVASKKGVTMDEAVVERMREVNALVSALDPAVRGEAFSLMREYILGGTPSGAGGSVQTGDVSVAEKAGGRVGAPSGFDGFIDKLESEVPADNVMALAAFLYGQYGIEPLSVQEVKDLAERAGVTIPARPDMTLAQKTANKKKAFRKTGKGVFRPTTDGEIFLKATYGVKKGTKKRPKDEP
jgi:hypothetical protein